MVLCLALGCASDPGVTLDDPFADLDGKADGAGDFFQTEGWLLRYDSDRARLRVEGLGREGRYRDVEMLEHGARSERVRLDRGDALAGMRSFLLISADADEALRRRRVLEAAGLEVPRAVSVRWEVDDVDLGTRLLVEHVGDRFLRDRFDDDEGTLVRQRDETVSLQEALRLGGDERAALGERAVAATFDTEDLGFAAAASLALEELTFSFYAPEDGRFAPIPEEAADALEAGALDAALRHPSVRAAYAEALGRLIECLDATECGADRTRAGALADVLARHEGADAPDGYAFYPARRALGDGRFEIAYRNLDRFAVAVDLDIAGTRLALAHDPARDLWTGVVELDTLTELSFVVVDFDGVEHEREDPTRTGPLDPASVDVLTELYRVGLEVGEPSGLAAWGERLFVIGDEGDDVYEIDPITGSVLARIDVGVRGMEGVAVDRWRGELLVADEDRGLILRFDFEGEELGRTRFGWADDDADGGIEGLTVRPSDGHVLFAKERSPVRIAEMDRAGELLRRARVEGPPDLSALTIDPSDGRLYALSDEAQSLYRLDDAWEIEASWPIEVDKPEGLVVDAGRVFVVSDRRHELVAFELGR